MKKRTIAENICICSCRGICKAKRREGACSVSFPYSRLLICPPLMRIPLVRTKCFMRIHRRDPASSKYHILLFVRPSGVHLILPLLALFQDGKASLLSFETTLLKVAHQLLVAITRSPWITTPLLSRRHLWKASAHRLRRQLGARGPALR
jgi:hypothetical protein